MASLSPCRIVVADDDSFGFVTGEPAKVKFAFKAPHRQVDQLTAENTCLLMANKALRAERQALCNSRCGTAPGPPGLFLPFKAPPGLCLPQQVPARKAQVSQRKAEFDTLSEASTCSGGECADVSDVESTTTTVIIRNIPNRLSRSALADVFDQQGFGGVYNMIYLPIDFHTKVSFGYAFVTFTTEGAMDRFTAHFEGFSQWGGSSKKICKVVTCNDNESLPERVERYRNLPVMHSSVPDEFKPALFTKGQRVSFPEPTKNLAAPRTLKGNSRSC